MAARTRHWQRRALGEDEDEDLERLPDLFRRGREADLHGRGCRTGILLELVELEDLGQLDADRAPARWRRFASPTSASAPRRSPDRASPSPAVRRAMPASAALCSTGSTAIGSPRPSRVAARRWPVTTAGVTGAAEAGPPHEDQRRQQLAGLAGRAAHADADVGELRAQHVGPVGGAVHQGAVRAVRGLRLRDVLARERHHARRRASADRRPGPSSARRDRKNAAAIISSVCAIATARSSGSAASGAQPRRAPDLVEQRRACAPPPPPGSTGRDSSEAAAGAQAGSSTPT